MAPKAKKPKTDEGEGLKSSIPLISLNIYAISLDEARTTILKYMIAQNRPYNSTDVFQNLHQAIGKTLVGKVLDKLVEDKEITGKVFGKTTIYFANQNTGELPSAEQSREMDLKIASLKEEAAALKNENSANEKILAQLLNSEKTVDLKRKLDVLNTENDALDARLEGLRNGTRKLTVEDKERADKKLNDAYKEWRVRKKMFKEAWCMITESLPPKKTKELMETIGVETDEAVGVSYEDFLKTV
ncbi:UNVERIFIED_CONTAM: PSMC3 interacting protein [Siphonaria sp. JEL0065]|nr:PSMC3 interacting protein [Siphonaria sp. JEL0065]